MRDKERPPFIPYDRGLKRHARNLRRTLTEPERRLWFRFLRSEPVRFLRQKPLDRYVVDFYCSRARLAIELDGDSHFDARARARDRERDEWLASLGVLVLRFTNREVMENFEAVCERIREVVEERLNESAPRGNPPAAARRPPLSRG